MKRSDLKTGMVVQTRENGLYLVLRDTCFEDLFQNVKDVLWRDGGFWLDLAGYTEDLRRNPHADDDDVLGEGASEEQLAEEAFDWDIVAVFQTTHPAWLQMKRLDEVPEVKVLWTEIDGDLEDMTLSMYRLMHYRKKVFS